MESGKSVNDEILKLLPIVKLPIKSGDSCILTHFDDFDTIYVSKGPLLENSDFLNCVICSTGKFSLIDLSINFFLASILYMSYSTNFTFQNSQYYIYV